MEHRRLSQTMPSEWQTAFVVSQKMPWCVLLTAVKNYNTSLEKCKTFSSRPRPRLHDTRPRPRLSFCPRGASRPTPWSPVLHHWILSYVRNKLPGNILMSLYFTLVNPYYEYRNIVWGVKAQFYCKNCLFVRKKVIPIIINSPWGAYLPVIW